MHALFPFLFLRYPVLRILFIVFIFIFSLEILFGSFIVYEASLTQTRQILTNSVKRIQEDLQYKNGQWNTYKYTADPDLPNTYPLYILSADGFVIDRWKPVHGLLDTSDFKHLLSFDRPQTITTPTNQTWRIFSKPIYNQNSDILGVITVSNFITADTDANDVDSLLLDQINIISSKISVTNNTINTSRVDPRDIQYNVAFQIVDRFNKILAKNNNTNSVDQIPNFIDQSYVGNMLTESQFKDIYDTQTKEQFLIYTAPIKDTTHAVVGIIVIGKSISFIDSLIKNYFSTQIIFFLISFFVVLFIENLLARMYILSPSGKIELENIQKIYFNKATSTIFIGKVEIPIPRNTNQYYLCMALFSAPKKQWEIDELLEKFGNSIDGNWRKVYDAMILINKKVEKIIDEKLLLAKGKIYQINPKILSKISH